MIPRGTRYEAVSHKHAHCPSGGRVIAKGGIPSSHLLITIRLLSRVEEHVLIGVPPVEGVAEV